MQRSKLYPGTRALLLNGGPFLIAAFASVLSFTPLLSEKGARDAGQYLGEIRSNPQALRAFMKRMPKGAELHTHLSGTPTPDRLLQLAAESKSAKYFVSLPMKAESTEDPTAYAFLAVPNGAQPPANPRLKYVTPAALLEAKSGDLKAHLAEFRQANLINARDAKPLATFYATTFQRRGAVVNNREMLPRMIVDEIKNARQHHLSYLEIQLNPFPTDPTQKPAENERSINPTSAREYLQTLVDVVDKENKGVNPNQQVHVRFVLAFLRTSPRILTQLPIAFEIASGKDAVAQAIAGINLVGNEYSEDLRAGQFIAGPEHMRDYLLTLKRTYPRVHVALHAGEITTWDWHIRDSALAGAERIGHAVNLGLSPEDVDSNLLKRHSIAIEACPTSNHLLLGIPYASHPVLKFVRAGIPTTINTDDSGLFETNMSEEFARVTENIPDLTWNDLKQLARNSIEHSFASDETRRELMKRWENDMREFETSRSNWAEWLGKD